MMPGGHLATSLALSGVAYAATGSAEVATGCFAGGFLIDVDHYLDYLFFEKQWHRPSPVSFLRYYFAACPKKLILPLHSAEFMMLLLVVLLVRPVPLLVGYWTGALMHLIFDVLVNGDYALKRPVLFYFFAYRARFGFAAEHLLDIDVSPEAGSQPVRDFFRCLPVKSDKPRMKRIERIESA
jgi:hypothetical protein